MPFAEPWNAPEHGNRFFEPEQAKKMDIYSFGMLCFWLIFKAGTSVDLPFGTISSQFVSFEGKHPGMNSLQLWKKDSRLIEWVCCLVREESLFDNSTKDRLLSFFGSTLAFEPNSRCTDLAKVLRFLTPNR